jgi:DNA mismatch repair protein MutS2
MLYPSNLEEKIGFDKIKQAIRQKCTGEYGQSYVDNIKFSSDFELISKVLNPICPSREVNITILENTW